MLFNSDISSIIIYQLSVILSEHIFSPMLKHINAYLSILLQSYYSKFFGCQKMYDINIGQMIYFGQIMELKLSRKMIFGLHKTPSTIYDFVKVHLTRLGFFINYSSDTSIIPAFVWGESKYNNLFQKSTSEPFQINNLSKSKTHYDFISFSILPFSKLTLPKVEKEFQLKANETIKKIYSKNGICSSLISGKSGIGKSTIAFFTAKKLNCNIIIYTGEIQDIPDIWENFYVPGHPIIFVVDEIEQFVFKTQKMCELLDIPFKKQPEDCTLKSQWNNFFDSFQNNCYPGLVVFMTTNLDIKILEKEYPAMFNDSRINLKIQC